MATPVPLQHEYYVVALGIVGLSLGGTAWLVGTSYGLTNMQLASLLASFAAFVVAAVALFRARVEALCADWEQRAPRIAVAAAGSARETMEAVGHGTVEIDSQVGHSLDELQRLRVLLDEAIGSLVGTFDALDQLATHQLLWTGEDASDASTGPGYLCANESPKSRAAFVDFVAELQQHIETAAITLQFHDMASQLVGHTRQRMEQARELARGLNAIATTPEVRTYAQVHDSGRGHASRQAIANLVVEAQRVTRDNPVRTARVATGGVELF